jgi:hypothetical protein
LLIVRGVFGKEEKESKIGRNILSIFLPIFQVCFDDRAYFRILLLTIAIDRAATIAMTTAAPIIKVGWR